MRVPRPAHQAIRTIGDRLATLRPSAATGYRIAWRVMDRLPAPVVYGTARLITRELVRRYWRTCDLSSPPPRAGIGRLHANLAIAMGCTRQQVRYEDLNQALWSYARYWVEAFRLPGSVGKDLIAKIDPGIVGHEDFAASYAEGKGVILVLSHSGNWDMAGFWLAHNYGGFATVAERLKPESLYQDFLDYRQSLGFTVYPLTGGEQPPMESLRQHLQRGEVVCLIGERDLKRHGQPVTFFGREVTIPTGAATLARDTGAPLHAIDCWFDGDGWGLKVRPRIDSQGSIADICQQLASDLEAGIRLHPHDWHMLQPMWPDEDM